MYNLIFIYFFYHETYHCYINVLDYCLLGYVFILRKLIQLLLYTFTYLNLLFVYI